MVEIIKEKLCSVFKAINTNLTYIDSPQCVALVHEWLRRLAQEERYTAELSIRLSYASYLNLLIELNDIQYPFNECPPQGPLPPLEISNILNFEPKYYGPEKVMEDSVSLMRHLTLPQFKPNTVDIPVYTCRPCCSDYTPSEIEGRDDNSWCYPSVSSIGSCPVVSGESYTSQMSQFDECYTDNRLDFDQQPPSFASLKSDRSQNCKIDELICSIDEWTKLEEFASKVAPHTSDQGTLLFEFLENSIAEFRNRMKVAFETRNRDIADLVTEEQIALKQKYQNWQMETLGLAEEALNNLKNMLPSFDIELYEKDPNYIRKLLTKKMKGQFQDVSKDVWLKQISERKNWISGEVRKIEKLNEKRMNDYLELKEQYQKICSNSSTNAFNKINQELEHTLACLKQRVMRNRSEIYRLSLNPDMNQEDCAC